MLTGRGVTTQMLIEEQILEPGEKALSINYLVSSVQFVRKNRIFLSRHK